MSRVTLMFLCAALLHFSGLAAKTPTEHSPRVKVVETFSQLPLSFEPNVGQLGSEPGQRVKFISRGPSYTVFLSGDEAILALRNGKSKVKGQKARVAQTRSLGLRLLPMDNGPRITEHVLRMCLVGANPDPKVIGLDQLPGKTNYFFGDDPEKWRADVPTYARVEVENLYPGIDLIYHGNHRRLEYDFVVAPGADPHAITLSLETGNSKLDIDKNGDLAIRSAAGELRFHKPIIYQPAGWENASANSQFTIQNSQLVDGRFILLGDNRMGFEVAAYDKTRPLVIDPVLVYASYLGGGTSDLASGVAVDSSGNAYVTGYTLSTNFPATSGVFQTSNSGGSIYGDVFITKLNATGSAAVYSTYLGGSNDDVGVGIAVDSSGNAYVAGYTRSTNFPTTSGAFRKTLGGGTCGLPATAGQSPSAFPCGDAFAAKLNASGNALVYSTYLGGGLDDWGLGIALDASGNAYVTGYAESTDFPTTFGAYQPTFAGGTCGGGPCATVFVSMLTTDGSALAYSTYLGGSGGRGYGIVVDSSGNAYLTGSTDSTGFPTTLGAFRTASAGNGDAFVAKLNAFGSALVYSTYLGGGGGDVGTAIALDSSGNAYVTGLTSSTNFPVTSGVLQSTCGGCQNGFHDAFVLKLNPAGAGPVYSTFLGGSSEDLAYGIAVDPSGNAFVTGRTLSTDFPTANPFQPACGGGCANGGSDVFIAALNPSGSVLLYSTYFGGSGNDSAYGIALDSSGNAYVTGSTTSTDLVTTSGAFARSLGGGFDAIVAKISPANAPGVSLSSLNLTFVSQKIGIGSSAQSVTLQNIGSAALSISSLTTTGDFSQTNTCGSSVSPGSNCTVSVTFTPTTMGTRTGSVSISDNAAGSPQVISLTGSGVDQPIASFSAAQVTFGSQLVGTASSVQTVTLANTGTTTLTISSVATSGEFTQANTCGSSVTAGASCAFSVTFAPTSTGTRSGTLSVTDDAAGSPQAVSLSGTGVAPAVNLSATSLTFGNQLLGTTSAAQTVTLTNTGTAALSVSGMAASGDFAETNSCRSSVGPGASCTVSVSFTPSTTGARSGSVTITDSAAGSPQIITLSGTGVAPGVNLSATSLTFGNQPIGTTSGAQLVTLTNVGSATLTISVLTVNGDFAQANNCGTSLAAGSNCAISVTFTPTAAGPRTGSVTITDTATGSPQSVSLTGTGVLAFQLSANASTIKVIKGVDSVQFTISASSSSGFSGSIALACSAGAPASCGFDHGAVSPGQSATLTVSNLKGAAGNSLGVNVTGSSGSQSVSLSLTVFLADYSLSISPPQATMPAGQAASYEVTIAPLGGFDRTVSLACGEMPPASNCSLSASTVTLDGSTPSKVTVTVTTTARARGGWRPTTPPRWLVVTILVCALGWGFFQKIAGSARPGLLPARGTVLLNPACHSTPLMAPSGKSRGAGRLGAALLLSLVAFATACGGGGGGPTASVPPRPAGTPAGTYSITTTGAFTDTSPSNPLTLTHSAAAKLVVN